MCLLTAKQKTTFAHQSNNLFLKRPKTVSFRKKSCLYCVAYPIGIRTTLVVE